MRAPKCTIAITFVLALCVGPVLSDGTDHDRDARGAAVDDVTRNAAVDVTRNADGRRLAPCETPSCCDSESWRAEGRERHSCAWVEPKKMRCLRTSLDGVAATEACPVTCGTCDLVQKIAVLEEELAATRSSLDAALATCGPFPTPTTTVEKVECLSNNDAYEGVLDHCSTCCPECTAVDKISFESHFTFVEGDAHVGLSYWTPTDDSGCVCLDLAASDYTYHLAYDGLAAMRLKYPIKLSDFQDCLRITGDDNRIYGQGGADAMVAIGDHNSFYGFDGNDVLSAVGDNNRLSGGDGDDVLYSVGYSNSLFGEGGDDSGTGDDWLTMDGTGGTMRGDSGNDICTDLGDNDMSSVSGRCDECYIADDGVIVDCDTRLPVRRRVAEAAPGA